jgi:hypothetical protein
MEFASYIFIREGTPQADLERLRFGLHRAIQQGDAETNKEYED